MEAGGEHLRNRRDEIDLVQRNQRQHGARAEDEHDGDDRRGDDNRLSDGANGVAALAGVNRDVLESAERAESHLPEQIQTHDRNDRRRRRERMKRSQRSVRHVEPWNDQQCRERDEHQRTARLVHPLADAEAENREPHERAEEARADQRNDRLAGRQRIGALSDDVRDVLRRLQTRLRRVEDGEQPQVPRDEKSRQLVEPELGPLIQPAFERHQPIEVDDDDGRRHVEEHHREEPEHDVRGTELRGHADPRQPNDEKDLREREIGEPELARQITRRRVRIRLRGIDGRLHLAHNDRRTFYSSGVLAGADISICFRGRSLAVCSSRTALLALAVACSRDKNPTPTNPSRTVMAGTISASTFVAAGGTGTCGHRWERLQRSSRSRTPEARRTARTPASRGRRR
ncbi:MAG: hypothetical protein AUJ01_10115 [Acidobacteria bacterium 13_1_40CM_3_65_5]|nr:MAG: hypothetical protein AUJ01_10115 [Acidobacteria bacterium 13_1_40CM_3_65_5]